MVYDYFVIIVSREETSRQWFLQVRPLSLLLFPPSRAPGRLGVLIQGLCNPSLGVFMMTEDGNSTGVLRGAKPV